MMDGFIAIHYPHRAHHDEFVFRVKHAADVMRSTPGCLAADCWVTPTGEAVISVARWESEAARLASMATAKAAGVDFRYDDREARPREIFVLRRPR